MSDTFCSKVARLQVYTHSTIPFGDWWEPGAPIGGNSGIRTVEQDGDCNSSEDTRQKIYQRRTTVDPNWFCIVTILQRQHHSHFSRVFLNHHCTVLDSNLHWQIKHDWRPNIDDGRHTTSGASNSGLSRPNLKTVYKPFSNESPRFFSFSWLEIFVWMVW